MKKAQSTMSSASKKQGTRVFIELDQYRKKVFFTSLVEVEEETVYVVTIPRSRHHEPQCVAAKQKELSDYSNYDVYDIVDKQDHPTLHLHLARCGLI